MPRCWRLFSFFSLRAWLRATTRSSPSAETGCTIGESGPTIVFEAGLGNDSTTWKSVAGPIAAFARVVLYDRVGLGQSSQLKDTSAAITADEVASRLHALLAQGSGHDVQLDRPETVVEAVRRIAAAARAVLLADSADTSKILPRAFGFSRNPNRTLRTFNKKLPTLGRIAKFWDAVWRD